MIPIENCKDFDLMQAWKMHGKADRLQGLPPASAHILLFYAVECGLKHLLLAKHALRACPYGRQLFHSHDLARILRELSPSAAEVGASPPDLHLELRAGKMRHQPSGDAHSAWRYGLSIQEDNEKQIVEWLRQVNRFIAKKRRQP
ncbi:MAG: hypothetical protein HQM00_16205 [Magnetococcales bacterium]|nr:hypothetical protein [Magnetococcales bacterium]